LEDSPVTDTWYCAALFGGGIQVTGTMEDAQEMLKKLAAFVETTFKEHGIKFVRKQQSIVRKPTVGGPIDLDEQLDAATSENGVGGSD
jgi:hypothetical protein